MKRFLVSLIVLLASTVYAANPTTLTQTGAQVQTVLNAVYIPGLSCDGSTDDSTAINTAIASGGSFRFPPYRVCMVSSPIVVPSNTTLDLNGATIKQTTSNNKYTMVTKAYAAYRDITSYPSNGTTPLIAATAVEITSLTASSNTVSAVTGSAHGLSVGEYVSIFMAAHDGYNGTYRVASAADTTHFTYLVSRSPSVSPTTADAQAINSKIYCVPATINMIIKNGVIDHNNNGVGGSLGTMAVMALGLYNSTFRDLQLLHAPKYCIYGGNLNTVVFEDIYAYTTSAIIQFYGGSRNVKVNRISGYAEDDAVCAIAKDYLASFPYVHVACGDIENIEFSNIDVKSLTCPVAIYNFGTDRSNWQANHNYALGDVVQKVSDNGYAYEVVADAGSSGGSEPTWPTFINNTVADGGLTWRCRPKSNFFMRGISIKNIDGSGSTLGAIKIFGVGTNRSYLEDVVIDGVGSHYAASGYGVHSSYADFSSLIVNNVLVGLVDKTNENSVVLLEYGGVSNLVFGGIKDLNNREKNDAPFALIATPNFKAKKITYQNIDLSYRTATAKKAILHAFSSGSQVDHIVISDCRMEYGNSLLTFYSGSSVSLIELRSGTFIEVTSPLDLISSTTIIIGSVYATNSWGSGFIWADTGEMTIMGNMPVLSSILLFDTTGTGVVNLRSVSLRADVTKVKKTAGNIFYNTNGSAGGSLTTGIVYCNGTSWYNIENPAHYWTP